MLPFFEGDGRPCRAGRAARTAAVAVLRGDRRSPGSGGEGDRQTPEHARKLHTKVNGKTARGEGRAAGGPLSLSSNLFYYPLPLLSLPLITSDFFTGY